MIEMTLAELMSEDDALARDKNELAILRKYRRLPQDSREQATMLIDAVLDTLDKPQDKRN